MKVPENINRLSLEEIQNEAFRLLCEFADYCEQNGLRYYLAYGALLGAARAGDLIPWDDDIDVVMLREDYEKLLKLSPRLGDCRLMQPGTSDYPWNIAKIVSERTGFIEPQLKHTGTYGVYLDIFPLDSCDGVNDEKRLKKVRRLKSIKNWAYDADYECVDCKQDSIMKIKQVVGVPLRVIKRENLVTHIDRASKGPTNYSAKRYGCFFTVGTMVSDSYEIDDLISQSYIKLRGRSFSTFGNFEKVLSVKYGPDWQTPKKIGNFEHGIAFWR